MKFPNIKSFLNDSDGLTIAEFTIMVTLPLYLFVGVKYAIAQDLSTNQVDFFGILSYPILAAIAKQAIERFGFPSFRNKNNNYINSNQGNSGYSDNYDGYNNDSNNTNNTNNNSNIIINSNKPTI